MSTPDTRLTSVFEVRTTTIRRAFWLTLIPAVVLAAEFARAEVVRVPAENGEEWSITIAPAPKSRVRDVVAASPVQVPFDLQAAVPSQPALPLVSATVAQADGVAPAPVAETPAAPGESVEHGIAITPYPTTTVPQDADYQRIYNSIPFSRAEYLANPSYRYDTTMELMTGHQRQIVVHRNYTPKLHGPSERGPLFLYNRYGGYYGGAMGLVGPGFGWGGYPWFNYTPGYPPAFRYFMPLEDLY